MRNTYDLDERSPAGSALPNDMAYSSHVEKAQPQEPSRKAELQSQIVPTLLVEPNTLLREGLKRILQETAYKLAVSAAGLEDIRRAWAADGSHFLLIAGVNGDQAEALSQIRQVKEDWPSARVVVLVDHYDLTQVLSAYEAGVDAYLLKSVSCEVLLKALDLVMLGETFYPAATLSLAQNHASEISEAVATLQHAGSRNDEAKLPSKGLSVRETVILRCLMEGASNKHIARKFDITEATVKVHVKAILRKIRASNRTQAAIWAASHLPPDDQITA